MALGYVYVLVNSAMPGYLKIGKTDRTSEERAGELSFTSGVPARFQVAYDAFVSDCDAVERLIHTRFAKYRPSDNREFFCVPLKEAIQALGTIAAEFPTRQTTPSPRWITVSSRPGWLCILMNALSPSRLMIEASEDYGRLRAIKVAKTIKRRSDVVVMFEERVYNCRVVERMIEERLGQYRAKDDPRWFQVEYKWVREVVLEIANQAISQSG